VDRRCSLGGLTGGNSNLIQPFDHVASSEQAADRRLLMLVDDNTPCWVSFAPAMCASSERGGSRAT
jgi:hypothetical protein